MELHSKFVKATYVIVN